MSLNRKIKIIAVGKIKHAWIQDGLNTYLKRCPGLSIIEIKDSTPEKEQAEIVTHLKPSDKLIALSERGELWDSIKFSHWLAQATTDTALVFAIGGPVGISPRLTAIAHTTLALSPMTFTHDMARLLLVEQLYRTQNILQNGNYHK
jgi:23S rRNA (pseudouridine1915-N3)-methyltransferase